MLTPGQCKNKYHKRASKRECVTYWLQGNSAKHLITAVPGNLNLSKRIQCSQCLIAVDGSWSVMHDNVCVTLLPAYVHSCQPSLQVMSTASLTRGERGGGEERERKKRKSPHRHKATCTQITQATATELQKGTAKASFYQPLYPSSFMLKKKKKKKCSICDRQYSNWQDSSLLFAWLYVWTHAWGCTEQFELQSGSNEHYRFWWTGALKTSFLS